MTGPAKRTIRRLARWVQSMWRRWVGVSEPRPTSCSWSRREADHLLSQAAVRLGFTRTDQGTITRIFGERGEVAVAVEIRRIPWMNEQVRFEQRVRVRAPLDLAPAPLELVPRGDVYGGVATRDAAFDADVMVVGPADVALALLSSAARAVVGGNGGSWRVAGPDLEWTAQRAPVFLAATTEQIIDLARMFAEAGADVVAALALRVRHDPDPGVRRRAFGLLLARCPEDPRTIRTARAALDDRWPRLRLDAALALGDDGRSTLLDLLESPTTPRGLRLAVANHLPHGADDVRGALHRLFDRSEVELRVMALELLGRLGSPDDLVFLEAVARRLSSGARVRRGANDARARILARHADRSSGQLALAPRDDERRGAVSAPDGAKATGAGGPT